MTQSSWFSWTTDGTGDGTATGYTMAQLSKMLHMLLNNGIANQGVMPAYLNGLAPSNPAGSTIRIETGGAQVHGTPYENDAQANFTPGDGTYPALPVTAQIHRVVLRKSWAAQTVRIAFISGTDAGSPSTPSLTQTDLTTWEIPLYQFQINSAGTVSGAVDQRELTYAGSIRCRLTYNSAQLIPTATDTDLTNWLEQEDILNMHSTGNPERITVPRAGIYLCEGGGRWAPTTNGTYRDVFIAVDGTNAYGRSSQQPAASPALYSSISVVLSLTANQYVTLRARHDRGSDLSFDVQQFSVTLLQLR